MANRIVAHGWVALADDYRNLCGPPLLLAMGTTASTLSWPSAFCEGRHVIRYDNRGAGPSTSWPRGEPGHAVEEMAGDMFAEMSLDGTSGRWRRSWRRSGSDR